MEYGEDQAMQRVVETLVAAFPRVPEPDVRACVNGIRARFATARVRAFLSILVAREARVALRGSVTEGDRGSAVRRPDGDPRDVARRSVTGHSTTASAQ